MIEQNEHSSRHLIELTDEPVRAERLIEFVTSPESGAVVLFLGTVREWTAGQQTQALEYEAYPEMALSVLQQLAQEAESRWPVQRLALQHRLGRLELAEVSVGIAVAAPHREDAYAASRFLIDELKKRVPIWKKEHGADGTTEWIHPLPNQKP